MHPMNNNSEAIQCLVKITIQEDSHKIKQKSKIRGRKLKIKDPNICPKFIKESQRIWKNKSHAQLLSDEIAEVPEKKIRAYFKKKAYIILN